MNRIRLDIEMVGKKPTEEEVLIPYDQIKVPAQYKKPESIDAYREKEYMRIMENLDGEIEAVWRKRGLDLFKSNVICIGYSTNDDPVRSIQYADEEQNMRILNDICRGFGDKKSTLEWTTWNGSEFDIPIIQLRAMLYGFNDILGALPAHSRDKRNIDLMKRVTPTIYKPEFYSLKNICQYLGIPVKEGELDGKKVFDYWRDGRIDEIAEYCREDVEALIMLEGAMGIPSRYKMFE